MSDDPRPPTTRDRGRPALVGAAALLGYLGYGTLLLSAALVAWGAMEAGGAPTTVTLVVVVAVAWICLLLERVQPYTEVWSPPRKVLGLDLVHAVMSALVFAPIVRAGALAAVVALGAAVYSEGADTPWPHHWPLGVQVVLGVVLADLGAYTAHRLMHVTRAGWRCHVVHHSPVALHFLASARTHPFNIILTLGAETLPVVALGANPWVIALMTIVKGTNGLLQHSNIDFRPGWLSNWLATNEVHWWHHSVHLEESNRNFGNSTMVWDRLFGTWFLPTERSPGVAVGVADAAIPEHYLWHMAAPFLLQRFERAQREADRQGRST